MLEFSAPAWLLGLLLLPLLRRLHRSGAVLREQLVADLELWPEAPFVSEAEGLRPPPDPAWRRRALALATLSLALAAPVLTREGAALTVWIDDTPSLALREAGGTRIGQALAALDTELGKARVSSIVVRRSSEPWRAFTLDALRANPAAFVSTRLPSPPPAALLARERRHWLLTDASNAATVDWLARAPLERVLQVGTTADNVGLTLLAARPMPSDPTRLALQLRIDNGGAQRERRRLELRADGVAVQRREIELGAFESAVLATELPGDHRSLVARLTPGDALAGDDAIELELGALARLRVDLDATCPAAVAAAVHAHPALRVDTVRDAAGAVALGVDCGALREGDAATPRIVLPGAGEGHAPDTRLPWSVATRIRPQQTAAPAPRLVSTSIDPRAAAALGPQFALWIATLADEALQQPLLGRVAHSERAAASVRVAAITPLRAPAPTAARATSGEVPLQWPLLALAGLALAWELVALLRRRTRLQTPVAAAA